MKTIIITLAIASFFSFTNICLASAKGDNEISNKIENNTKTIVSFSKKNNPYLNGNRKSVIKYDENGNRTERILYTWNKGEGIPVSKYKLFYNQSNTLNKILFVKWNNQSKKWENKAMETQYFFNSDNYMVTVNQEIDYSDINI